LTHLELQSVDHLLTADGAVNQWLKGHNQIFSTVNAA